MAQLGYARDRWLKYPIRLGQVDYTDSATQLDLSSSTYVSFAAWVMYGVPGQSLRIFTQLAQPSGTDYLTLRSTGPSEFTFIGSSGSTYVSDPSNLQLPYYQPLFYAGRVDINSVANNEMWRGGLHTPPIRVKNTAASNGTLRGPKPSNYLKIANFVGGGGDSGWMSLILWDNHFLSEAEVFDFWRSGIWRTKPYGAWTSTRSGLFIKDFSGNQRNFPTAAFDGGPASYGKRTRKRWVAVPQWWIPVGGTTTPQSVSGTLTSAGALSKLVDKENIGTLSSVGALSKEVDKNVNGVLSFVGVVSREVDRDIVGDLDFSGNLAISKLYARDVDGNFSFVGVLVKDIEKNVAGVLSLDGTLVKDVNKLLSGSLGFSGDISRQIDRDLSGVLSFDGALTRVKSFTRSVDGDITLAGSITYEVQKSLSGSLSLSGDLVRDIFKLLAGTVSSTGNLNKQIYKSFDGAITFDGDLNTIKAATQSASGSLTLNGFVLTEVNKNLDGILSLNGGLVRDIDKGLVGSLSFNGNLNASIVGINQDVDGVLSFNGGLSAVHIPFVPGTTKSSSARGPFTARYRRVIV